MSAQKTPTMKFWTDAWQSCDITVFKNLYLEKAVIFPPNKPAISGNQEILDYMQGGIGKMKVTFHPDTFVMDENLAFEHGFFKDSDLKTGKVTAKGRYSVTWIFDGKNWKINCHAWSSPEERID